MGKDPADILLNYYRNILPKVRKPLDLDPWKHSFKNEPHGLGDCIMLTDLPHAAKSSVVDRELGVHSHSPAWKDGVEPMLLTGSGPYKNDWIRADAAYMTYNLGNGHLLQRFRRLYGIEPELKPHGKLRRDFDVVPNRVCVHFDAGKHQTWQQKHIHKKARQVYPENLSVIDQFIKSRSDLEFVEVGSVPSGIKGTKDCTGISCRSLIQLIGTCEWFLGIVSGPMHVAASYGCKSIVILNFPAARKIMLPTLVDTNQIESEWLYPQNIHLHQDNAGPLVPHFTADSLGAAFNGEVYPYFKESWLELIHETKGVKS